MIELRPASDSERRFLAERAPYMHDSRAKDVADGMAVSAGVLDDLLRQAENVRLPEPIRKTRKVSSGNDGGNGVRPSKWQELPPLEWMITPPRQVTMRPRREYRRVNPSDVRVRVDQSVKGTGRVGSIYDR